MVFIYVISTNLVGIGFGYVPAQIINPMVSKIMVPTSWSDMNFLDQSYCRSLLLDIS